MKVHWFSREDGTTDRWFIFWLLVFMVIFLYGLAVNIELSGERHGLEVANLALRDQTEAQKEQIDLLIEEHELLLRGAQVLLAEKLKAEKQYFMISHFPFPGEPWTIEKYWAKEELWIALQSYSSRTAAEDVKVQLESGELKTRDLFR